MQKIMIYSLVFMFMLVMPMAAQASNCCPTDKHGEQGDEAIKKQGHKMEGHAGHDMHEGGFVLVGEQTVKNVKAIAKIMVYDAEKVAMTNATHHIMVYFKNAETGNAITDGKAALKVKDHDVASKPMMLVLMGDGFGTDLRIDKGHNEFEVGTKLEDGKKRQFKYDYIAH